MINFFYKEYFIISFIFFFKQNSILESNKNLNDFFQLRNIYLIIFFIIRFFAIRVVRILSHIHSFILRLKISFNLSKLKPSNIF